MKTKSLGRTGMTVSEVGFGGIPISRLDHQDAVDLISCSFQSGITFFDTANAYGDSEKKIGRALQNVRDRVVIATKTLARDYDKASDHIERSLNRLQTDYIDIYQIHQVADGPTLETVIGEQGAYAAMIKAVEEKKIRSVGITSHNIETAIAACRTDLFDTIQIPFNFIEQEPAEELFDEARKQNMGIIGMKPIGGGLLERADLCFGFLRQYPFVIPIPGIQEADEIKEIVGLYESPRELTATDLSDIEKIRRELGTRFCRRCEYCMPCRQEVDIPGILRFKSVSKRFSRERTMRMLDSAVKTYDDCIECGDCMKKCPYDLPITELLKENTALFRAFLKDTPS